MSTQIVLPTSPSPSSSSSKSNPSTATTANKSSSSSTTTTKTNRYRFRPQRKPELQLDKNELKQQLTPLQYKITQEKFTERPYSGEYLRLNDQGIYCCIVCGEEIFSSDTKYDSGCGWPAFYDTIDGDKLINQMDLSHVGGNLLLLALNQDLARTEVKCAKCGAHLGHVFDDGPRPTGKRYCVNSAALKFKKSNGEEIICDTLLSSSSSTSSCCFRSPTKINDSKSSSSSSSSTLPPTPTTTTTLPPSQPTTKSSSDTVKDDNSTKTLSSDSLANKTPLSIPTKPCRQSKQSKTKSLSPATRTLNDNGTNETTTTTTIQQPSLHARKVQMNREDFFKSSPSSSNSIRTSKYNEINDRIKNSLSSSSTATTTTTTTTKPISINNRARRIAQTFDNEQQQQNSKNDMNNNNQYCGKLTNLSSSTTANNKLYSDVKSRYLDHLDMMSKKSVIKHTFTSLSAKKSSSSNSTTTTVPVLESDL